MPSGRCVVFGPHFGNVSPNMGRPLTDSALVAFRRRIVTLVEQCLECFERDSLIPLWGRVAHCFSCAWNRLICAFTTREYDHNPEVAKYFINLFRTFRRASFV